MRCPETTKGAEAPFVAEMVAPQRTLNSTGVQLPPA
jgi:hypothetical protein